MAFYHVLAYRFLGRFIVRQQNMRISQFEVLPKPAADVVFLGDSITEYGLWNEWFPRHRVINRGIAGDTSGGVLSRVGAAVGTQRTVSLLIGTNDLALGVSESRIAANVAGIVAAIRAADPGSKILLNSVMPRTRAYQDRIGALNRRLALLATAEATQSAQAAGGTRFLDLWPALAAADGGIRPEFSADRLHLNGAGYAAWVEVLREHIP